MGLLRFVKSSEAFVDDYDNDDDHDNKQKKPNETPVRMQFVDGHEIRKMGNADNKIDNTPERMLFGIGRGRGRGIGRGSAIKTREQLEKDFVYLYPAQEEYMMEEDGESDSEDISSENSEEGNEEMEIDKDKTSEDVTVKNKSGVDKEIVTIDLTVEETEHIEEETFAFPTSRDLVTNNLRNYAHHSLNRTASDDENEQNEADDNDFLFGRGGVETRRKNGKEKGKKGSRGGSQNKSEDADKNKQVSRKKGKAAKRKNNKKTKKVEDTVTIDDEIVQDWLQNTLSGHDNLEEEQVEEYMLLHIASMLDDYHLSDSEEDSDESDPFEEEDIANVEEVFLFDDSESDTDEENSLDDYDDYGDDEEEDEKKGEDDESKSEEKEVVMISEEEEEEENRQKGKEKEKLKKERPDTGLGLPSWDLDQEGNPSSW